MKLFSRGLVLFLSIPPCAFSAILTFTPEQIAAESAKANDVFERSFQDSVDRSPEFQTFLGIKKDYDKWDDPSEARYFESLSRNLGFLAELKRTVNLDALDAQTRLSYRLYEYQAERRLRGSQFRDHGYSIDQTGGALANPVDTLTNFHRIDTVDDARAYIARLQGIGPLFDELILQLSREKALNCIPPRWVFPKAAEIAHKILEGAPFDASGKNCTLWADFTTKVSSLKEVSETTREKLLADARSALIETVKPAYDRVLTCWKELESHATNDDGVWKFENGAAFYNNRLANTTTTPMTAEEIHALGLREVARIQGEMRGIMQRTHFTGDLPAFLKFMRDDPRFYLPDTDEGRKEYLQRVTAVIDDMRPRLDTLFKRKPLALLLVKATEAYREKTAAGAFYMPPAVDGSRPGVYYETLYRLDKKSTYSLEATAYHEAIPGHHMQLSIAQEMPSLPRFRKHTGGFVAYVEGWGLYAELLPKEMGLYQDPYSDFGRLAMELLRAVRLVVDTGIHAKRWTRQQAIDYFLANTSNTEAAIVREVERYIMWPGQATAYKIGMMKILELRQLAKQELGAAFDIREFHDVVLRDGALPLDMLEEQVRAWIALKKSPSKT